MKFPILLFSTLILNTILLGETMKSDFKRSEIVSETTPYGSRIDRFTLYSPSMERDIKVAVVLPPAYTENPEERFPVLYTLHGHAAPYDTWASMPILLKQLNKTPFVYTCFDGDNGSFYIDSHQRVPTARKNQVNPLDPRASLFQTFFFDEFMPAIDHWYRINSKARGITGFSMGGNGALTYTLDHPELFTASSGLSTAFFDFSLNDSKGKQRLLKVLGPMEDHPEKYQAVDHYVKLEKQLEAGVTLPPMYQHIGTEDFLLEENHKFRDFANEHGLNLIYKESPGNHNWKFWNAASLGIAEFHWKYFQQALSETQTP
ncbi:alpha/beta hydrolase-fold protein [Kiritimatiellaeota bacterium B1221]|nr:alpha/beta hydrolase-fold protein [Kiritimatiellaeota bacterium B1221]